MLYSRLNWLPVPQGMRFWTPSSNWTRVAAGPEFASQARRTKPNRWLLSQA